MSKEAGSSRVPPDKEQRRSYGLRVWEDGESFRPGKTEKENKSGQKLNYLKNKKARAEDNRTRSQRTK